MPSTFVVAQASADAVQQGLVNGAGAVVGIGGLLLVVAWMAHLYR